MNLLTLGCGVQIIALTLGWLVSYPATTYTMNYWGSQVNGCPFTVDFVPAAIVNTVAFGTGAPILAAGGTFAWDTINQNDVIPGPRAQRKNLPLCD